MAELHEPATCVPQLPVTPVPKLANPTPSMTAPGPQVMTPVVNSGMDMHSTHTVSLATLADDDDVVGVDDVVLGDDVLVLELCPDGSGDGGVDEGGWTVTSDGRTEVGACAAIGDSVEVEAVGAAVATADGGTDGALVLGEAVVCTGGASPTSLAAEVDPAVTG